MISDAEYLAWLDDQSGQARRTVLVEAVASVDGVETTFYWSTRGYTTGGTVNPITYLSIMSVGMRFTEQISLTNKASLSAGDIELHNLDGSLDEYLGYVWTNRQVKAWVGDVTWDRADFRLEFVGVAAEMDSKGPEKLNLKLRDQLQRLNTPVTEAKLPSEGVDEGALVPQAFGELHNITPPLADGVLLQYRVHSGPIEEIHEVRDNGKPVLFTASPATGTFILEDPPEGLITCSMQGDKPSTYTNRVGPLVQRLATGYGKPSERFGRTSTLEAGLHPADTSLASFSRACPAWYTGPTGALVQVGANVPRIEYDTTQLLEENRFTYSEEFDSAAWAKNNVTVTPNATLAPSGEMTADRFTPTTTAQFYYYRGHGLLAGDWTYSVHVKSAGLTHIDVYYNHEGGGAFMVVVDLLTGEYTQVIPTNYTNAAVRVLQLEDGWFRVCLSATLTGITANVATALKRTTIANTTDGVYVWGAQFHSGLEPLPYQATGATALPKKYAPKGLLLEPAATNLQPYSEAGDGWGAAGTTPPTCTNSVSYLDQTCVKVDFAVGASGGYTGCRAERTGRLFSITAGTSYVWSTYVALSRPLVGSESVTVYVTGTNGFASHTFTAANCAAHVNTFSRVARSGTPGLTGSDYFVIFLSGALSSGLSVYQTRDQFEVVANTDFPPSSYITTGASATTRYADVATVSDDLDLDNLAAFDAACPQPVGLFLPDRRNILEVCEELASSVGAQLIASALGKLRLLRIALPPTGDTVLITPEHMVGRKLRVAETLPVKAGVKLGFCRNWTVQKGLLTTIPPEHTELFSKEWLTEVQESAPVKALYRLHAEPAQRDTVLLRRVDAAAEAQRELALWSTQRYVYEFEAYASLLHLELGQGVTLQYPRFGLDAGVKGIVVMRAPDWDNARVKLGILI